MPQLLIDGLFRLAPLDLLFLGRRARYAGRPNHQPDEPSPFHCAAQLTLISRTFGWREDDQKIQVFGDRMKSMRGVLFNEDHRAGADLSFFIADTNHRPPAEHIVDFVLGMRLLTILTARGQAVQS